MLNAKGTQIDAVLDFDVPDSLLVSSSRHWVGWGLSLRSVEHSFAANQKQCLQLAICQFEQGIEGGREIDSMTAAHDELENDRGEWFGM